MDHLQTLADEAQQAIAAAESERALDEVRVNYLGKKGALTALLKNLGQLSAEERPAAGAKINVVKEAIQAKLKRDNLFWHLLRWRSSYREKRLM